MAIDPPLGLDTGGAEFIESHLMDMLVQSGFPITVLDGLSTGTPSYINERATLIEDDVRATGLVDDLVKNADYGCHFWT